VLEWHEELGDIGGLAEQLRVDIEPIRVYIFTPDGHAIDLPKGATPLDFAYRVHTEIGHNCRGAKINGRIVPLNYSLQTGEQVEIITSKHGTPSRLAEPEPGLRHHVAGAGEDRPLVQIAGARPERRRRQDLLERELASACRRWTSTSWPTRPT
jgi:hypothetical protein